MQRYNALIYYSKFLDTVEILRNIINNIITIRMRFSHFIDCIFCISSLTPPMAIYEGIHIKLNPKQLRKCTSVVHAFWEAHSWYCGMWETHSPNFLFFRGPQHMNLQYRNPKGQEHGSEFYWICCLFLSLCFHITVLQNTCTCQTTSKVISRSLF